jgi:hypothetical protein
MAGFYNPRHYSALEVLDKAATQPNIPLLSRKRVDQVAEPGISDGTLRPDLTIFLQKPSNRIQVQVGDLKCYWPREGKTIEVNERNVQKYQAIANGYKRKYHNSEVITIMLPTAGPVPKEAKEAMEAMGYRSSVVCSILKDMMIQVVKENFKIANRVPQVGDALPTEATMAAAAQILENLSVGSVDEEESS